jgi:predicted phage tail protein
VSAVEAGPALAAAVDSAAELVRRLGDELATFRRRALQAESRVRQYEDGVDPATVDARVMALEAENGVLRARLDAATARTREMLERVRFLRQQRETTGER